MHKESYNLIEEIRWANHVIWRKSDFPWDYRNVYIKGGVSIGHREDNFFLIQHPRSSDTVDIAHHRQPIRFRCGSFSLICDWSEKAYPVAAMYTFTHILHTLFSKVWVGEPLPPYSAQDVQFIRISIRTMSLAREKQKNLEHNGCRVHAIKTGSKKNKRKMANS